MADIVSEYNRTYGQGETSPILDEFTFNDDGTVRAGLGGALRRLVPKAPPVKYPPKRPFEMPKYSKKVLLTPWVEQFIENEVIGKAKSLKDEFNNFKNDMEFNANEFMRKLAYPEPLVNEAVNRYISRDKK